MPIPAPRQQNRRATAPAAEENTSRKMVDDSQGSSVSSEAVAAGGGASDDRMDVGQSSASEADLTEDGSSSQGLWMRRLCYALLPRRWNSRLVRLQLAQLKPPPVVQPAELNANKIAVPRPHIRSRKNAIEVHLLEVLLNRLQKVACWVLSLYKGNPIQYLCTHKLILCVVCCCQCSSCGTGRHMYTTVASLS